jgi:hypothetical protein
MTNLTEKLKSGELPDNHHYYYRLPKGTYEVGNTFCLETLRYCKGGDKIEVIEEVPSYEQWQAKLEENTKLKTENKWYSEQLNEASKEIEKLKERIYEFAEANQSLRKQLDEERAKNRIDYYNGSPMDFLDECERDRKKNKIYKNWINNIREELIISDLRRTDEGNKFIVNLLSKINEVLGEE